MHNTLKAFGITKSIRNNIRRDAVIAFILAIALAFLQLASVLILPKQGDATGNTETLEFTELATHPQAAAMPANWQKQITELTVFKGKLLAGYGDYNSNIGPIAINPYDIESGSFEGVAATLPSESIGNWKEINGKLYTTTIDARGCGHCASGYAVSEDGSSWEIKTPINAFHIFDITTLNGSDLWLLGSSGSGDGVATAWRSVDNGESWNTVKISDNSGTRYYWGRTFDGKMYIQEVGGQNDVPMDIFDGNGWSTGTNTRACYGGDYSGGPNPIMFKNKMVCYWTDHLRTFNGQTVSLINPEPLTIQINDPGTYLSYGVNNSTIATSNAFYMLDFLQSFEEGAPERVLRSPDLSRWQSLEGLPSGTTAMTVDEDNEKIYVGTSDAKLYVADLPELPFTSEEEPTPNFEDANDDGITDSMQPNVSVMSNTVTGKTTVLELGDECEIQAANTESESSLSSTDSGFEYANALLNFTADCATPGATTTVKLFYYDVENSNFTLRKYNPNTSGYGTVKDALISQQTINGHNVLVAEYSVTDGEELDTDGRQDGIIVDPVGIAANTVGAPNTGL